MDRTLPLPGDIGLCRITGPVGWLIRFLQWLAGGGFADVEHAFVYVGDGRIIEAAPGGARETDLADYADRPIVWSTGRIPLTDAQRTAIVTAARSFVGVPYSDVDYAAIAAHRLHLPLPGLRTYVRSSGHMICSQLVDRAYQRAGVQLFADGRWDGYVMPASLDRLIR
jgi:cell wall-associated NlpC family hydrolase